MSFFEPLYSCSVHRIESNKICEDLVFFGNHFLIREHKGRLYSRVGGYFSSSLLRANCCILELIRFMAS
jgi:hypothetical protein